MTTPGADRVAELRKAEHLWLDDLRQNPAGEVRLYVHNRLRTGTAAYQVTASITEMLGVAREAGYQDGYAVASGDLDAEVETLRTRLDAVQELAKPEAAVWLGNEVDPADEFVYADELRAALGGADTGEAGT